MLFYELNIQGFDCIENDRIPDGLSCDANKRIIGGVKAKSGAWPWIVKLDISVGNFVFSCDGTIIHDEWILSAAHCFASSFIYNSEEKHILVNYVDNQSVRGLSRN